MVTLLTFLVLLLVLVVVHEAGHALMARATGCRVEEFGVGFPPRLWAKRLGETVFSVNALPIGGFVRLTGEDDPNDTDPRAFSRRSFGARASILVSGVIANVALAVVLFTLVAGLGLTAPVADAPGPVRDARVEIVSLEHTPALASGTLQPRDAILAVNDFPVPDADSAAQRIRAATGSKLSLIIRRDGSERTVQLQFDPPKTLGQRVGLVLLDVGTVRVPWREAPREGLRMTVTALRLTLQGFWHLLTTVVTRQEISPEISGPVGIALLTGTVARQGVVRLLEFAGVVSVNLAFINALPIPALDGGRLLFLILERLGIRVFRGRPERLAHSVGFALLLLLLIAVTVSDVRRLLSTP